MGVAVADTFVAKKIEYDAKVIDSKADVFSKETGLPLQWTVTYARVPSGETLQIFAAFFFFFFFSRIKIHAYRVQRIKARKE
jgi:hypothetical protein